MIVNRRLVLADKVAIRAVRHGHDVDVIEFGTALAPVTVGQDVMTPDFAARLDFASSRNRQVEKCVEAGDALAGGGLLDVLQESRKASDHLALVETFGHLEE